MNELKLECLLHRELMIAIENRVNYIVEFEGVNDSVTILLPELLKKVNYHRSIYENRLRCLESVGIQV